MNVANFLNRTINPFEKPNLDQQFLLKNLLTGNQNNMLNNQVLKNTSLNPNLYQNKNILTNPIQNNQNNNSNLNNLSSLFGNKSQQQESFTKDSSFGNQKEIASEKNSFLDEKNDITNNVIIKTDKEESNTINNKDSSNNIIDSKVNLGKINISPIESNNPSEGEESGEEEGRFFALDQKKENEVKKQKEDIILTKNDLIKNTEKNINNITQNKINLEELIKNPNNANIVNSLKNNEILKTALIKVIEKGDLQSLSNYAVNKHIFNNPNTNFLCNEKLSNFKYSDDISNFNYNANFN